jgi:hypothetical protein
MGIVVLRSTTPCVAVNSRSNSDFADRDLHRSHRNGRFHRHRLYLPCRVLLLVLPLYQIQNL